MLGVVMEFSQLIQNLVNGLVIGSVYVIFVLGYMLIFLILGIINFVQGVVFMLGVYLIYILVLGQFENNGLFKGINFFFDGLLLVGNFWVFGFVILFGLVLVGLIVVVIECFVFWFMWVCGVELLLVLVSSLGVVLVIVNFI